MRKAIITLVIAIIVLALAPLAIGEKGYVLIAFNNFTIEGSIVSFAISILITLFSAYLLFKLVRYVLSLYGITRFKFASRSAQKKQQRLETGLWQLLVDDYQGAMTTFKKGNVDEHWYSLTQAVLAKSSIKTGDINAARVYMQNIGESNQAKAAPLYLSTDQPDMAELVLAPVASDKKASEVELRSYCQFLLKQQSWQKLTTLLPRLEKQNVLTDDEWSMLFNGYFSALDKDVLATTYNGLSRSLKQKSQLPYLQAMIAYCETTEVEKSLIKFLKAGLFEPLFSVLASGNQVALPQFQKVLQGQLKKAEKDTNLLLCLAYVAKLSGDYELAAKVFREALSTHNIKQHWLAAAECYAHQGDSQAALALYQQYS